MTLPVGYLPREGDVVVIHAKVRFDLASDDGGVHLAIVGSDHTRTMLPLDNIHGIVARTWEAGDEVQDKRGCPGRVIAVHGGMCWVRWEPAGSYSSVSNMDIERLPPPPRPASTFLRPGPEF